MSNTKLPDNENLLQNLQPADNLECFPIELTKIMVDPQEGSMYAVMEANAKEIGFMLNSQEGTMLTFVRAGCGNNAHIKTIYQLYLETMQLVKCRLIKAVIEAKRGDVVYARLVWEDRKARKFFSSCSVGDALILTTMAGAKMEIVRKALDDMDSIGDWDYENEIVDG